jgi:glutaredoxin/glutathione-dependent peroxiredoxin
MIKIGDTIPEVTFMAATPDGPQPMTSTEAFRGKTVALFAVPGAFTPTCSARHLPSFKEKATELKERGVDLIACTSVNDAFVMGAWAKDQGVAGDILMLADGNGEFARAIGLTLDGQGFGMGERSKRYSMLVRDCKVEQLNVEEGGEYRVSSADYLLSQLS